MENKKLRKAIALIVAGVLVVTSMTFIGSNNLKAADENAANQVEQTAEDEANSEAETVANEKPSTTTEKLDLDANEEKPAPPEEKPGPAEGKAAKEKNNKPEKNQNKGQGAPEQGELQGAETEPSAALDEGEDENKMPAQSFNETAAGIRVSVTAPDGAFPEGTKLHVNAVGHGRAKDILAKGGKKVNDANGVEFSFMSKGRKIEPEKSVTVTMSGLGVKGNGSFGVYHVADNGAVTFTASASNGDSATFKASDFSIYVIANEMSQEVKDPADKEGQSRSTSMEMEVSERSSLKCSSFSGLWSSSNSGIVEVRENLENSNTTTVTAKAAGEAVVTCTDGNNTESFYITVKNSVTKNKATYHDKNSTKTVTFHRYAVMIDQPAGWSTGSHVFIGWVNQAGRSKIGGNGNLVVNSATDVKNVRSGHGTTFFEPGDSIKSDSDLDLYAVWAKDASIVDFTVTYKDGANGELFSDWTTTHKSGAATPQLSAHYDGALERDGYEFVGWAPDDPAENPTVLRNLLFVGQWRAVVTIEITGNTDTETYDGTDHSVDGYTFVVKAGNRELDKKDVTVTLKSTASDEANGTDAGTYMMGLTENSFDISSSEYQIQDVVVKDGWLKINKAKVTLRSADLDKEYDGTELVNGNTALATESGWIAGEGATYTFTGGQTEVGSSANAFDYVLNSNTKADNYDIEKTEGSLTVNNRTSKYEVSVTANSYDGTYDGERHTAEGFVGETEKGIPVVAGDGRTYYVTGLTSAATGKDVADSVAAIDVTGKAVVKNDAGTVVTDMFNVSVNKGHLTISKAAVELTSATDSKTYDKTPLTNGNVEVTAGAFVKNEGVEFTVTGSQTDVGTSNNDFTYTAKEGTDLENYDITKNIGTLTVAPAGSIIVNIEGNTAIEKFDGTTKYARGYVVTSITGSTSYSEEDFTFTGSAVASGIDAGEYPMGLSWNDFTNLNTTEYPEVTFVVTDGKLTITPDDVLITIRANSASKKYDGTALTDGGFTYTQNVLAAGDRLEATVEGTITDAGKVANKVTSYRVLRGTGENAKDVTGSYSFADPENGVLEITKRNVTLTSASDKKEYDGTALTNDEVRVTGDGFVQGEGFEADVTGSQTVKGSSRNPFSYTLYGAEAGEGRKETKAANYNITKIEGDLEVTAVEKEIVITADSANKTYDGTELKDGGFTYTEGVLVEGDVLEATVEGSITNAGTADNKVTSYKVMRGETDVTDHYTFGESVDGILEVTKRSVTLTSATDSKTYDGTALTNDFVEESGEGFILGEGVTCTVTGSQTRAGSSRNEFTYEAKQGTILDNYDITKIEGTLTVSKNDAVVVTITEKSGRVTYNGEEQSVTGYEVSISDPSYKEEDFSFDGEAVAKGTVAGEYEMKLEASDFTNNNDNFKDVTFEIIDGSLIIDPIDAEIIVTADSDSRTYDGTALTDSGFTYTEDVLLEGDVLEATVEGSITDAGTADNVITGKRVMRGALDVTDCYIFGEDVNGTLTVLKRPVTLTSATDSKTYDGTALTNDEVEVSGDGFVQGQGAEYEVTGSQTEKGTSDNTFTYSEAKGTDFDNYEITKVVGTLTVEAINTPIIVKANDDTKVYDGKPLTNSGCTSENAAAILMDGDELVATAEGTITNAGSVANVVVSRKIMRGNTDVTECYTFGSDVNGTLTVEKRAVTFTSATDSKTYDGAALTNDEVEVSGDGFAGGILGGEGVTFNVTGTQTLQGSSRNTFTYEAKDGTDLSNYEIRKIEGTLTVTAIESPITITADSDNQMYNGRALTNAGFTYTEDVLLEGDVLEATVEGSITNAGTAANKVTSYRVMRGDTDVTACYTFTDTEDGVLEVTKRPVTLTSATDSKTFDGTPLTNDEVKVSGEGFVSGEGVVNTVTGSQTAAGSSRNEFTYAAQEGTDLNNYEITKIEGLLTVAERGSVVVTITEHGGEFTYDKTEKSVKGYDVEISDPLYKKTDFTFGGNATVSGTLAGTYEMELKSSDFTNTNKDFKDVEFVIKDAEMVISPVEAKITVKAASDSKTYDGSALSNDKYTYTENVLLQGDELTAVVEGSITDFGTAANKVTSYKVMDGDTDVTSCYSFDRSEDGVLEITKRAVTLTSGSGEKTYDGTALTNDEVSVTAGSFVNGEGFTGAADGSITDVGTTENTFKYKLNERTKAANYMITEVKGTLTITPDPVKIILKAGSDEKVYDGEALTNGTWEKTSGTLHGSDELVVTVAGSITNVGTAANRIVSYSVKRGNDDVTENYTFGDAVDGTLKVTERAVTLTSGSDKKEYDGTPLTKDEVNVTEGSFVEGEGINARADGSRLYVGTSENTFGYTAAEGTDLNNYRITKINGTLEVVKNTNEIVVTAKSAGRKYDGTALTESGYTFTQNVLAEGDVLTAVVEGSITDFGTAANKVTSYVVKHGNEVVTGNYTFGEPVDGILEITKRSVTLKSKDGEWAYDGEAHQKAEVEVSGDGFVGAEGVSYSKFASITKISESTKDNTFEYALNDGTKSDNYIIEQIFGKLSITKNTNTIVVKAASDSKMYDGTPLTNGGYTYTENVLKSGDEVVTTVTGTITDAGTAKNVVGEVKIMHGEEDVTDNYTIGKSENGTLEITKRNVTLTSGDYKGMYDGKTHGNHEVVVSGDGFVDGEGAAYSGFAGIRFADESPVSNEFTYTLYDGTEEGSKLTKAGNYNISVVPGTLELNKVTTPITVKANSDKKMYDGQPLKNAGFSFTQNVLAEGDELTAVVEGSITDFGTADNVVTSYAVKHGDEVVTDNYTFTDSENGILEITKRSVELKSADDGKKYDGKPLQNTSVQVGGDGFVSGESASYSNFASATNVADSGDNTFDYTLVNAKAENYEITQTPGTLTITPADAKIIVANSSKEYNTPDPEFKVETNGLIDNADLGKVTAYRTNAAVQELGVYEDVLDADYTENGNYNVEVEKGDFEIVKSNALTLTCTDYTGIYDGEQHGFAAETNVTEGTTIRYSTDGGVNWSETVPVRTNVCDLTIKVIASNDRYNDKEAEYILRITPKAAEVVADNASKHYGQKDPEFTADVNGTLNDDTLKYTVERTGNDENAGTYENVLVADGDAEQGNYSVSYRPGTFTIIPQSVDPGDDPDPEDPDKPFYAGVKVEAPKDVVYNGKTQEQKPVVKDADGNVLEEGKDYTLEYVGDTTYVGEVKVIVHGIGNYTGDQAVTYNILKRKIVLASRSASKTYDGKVLKLEIVDISGLGLAEGDDLIVKFEDGLIKVGSKENRFDHVIVSTPVAATLMDYDATLSTGADVTSDYDVTCIYGTLKITDQVIPGPVPEHDKKIDKGGDIIRITQNADGGFDLTTIADGDAPLGNIFEDCCILHLLIMLLAWIILMIYTKDMKDRQARIFELEEELSRMGIRYW